MDKDFVKFAIKESISLATNAIIAGISYAYSKKAEKEGKTLISGISKGLTIVSATMVWITASKMKSAVSFPTVVIVD